MNFVAGQGSLNIFPKLFIPSVMCTDQQDVRNLWLHSRVMSLKSTIAMGNLMFKTPLGEARTSTFQMSMPKEGRREAAKASMKRTDVPPPCRGLDDPTSNECYGHGSLYRLWHYLKPYQTEVVGGTSTLSDKWFMVYFTVTSWAIVAALGLGSEITMGHTCTVGGATRMSTQQLTFCSSAHTPRGVARTGNTHFPIDSPLGDSDDVDCQPRVGHGHLAPGAALLLSQ